MRIHAPNNTGSLAISGSLVLNNGDAEFNSAEFSGNVSGSATSTGSFGQVIGEGHNLTNLQRPITTHISNFTASMTYAGHYNVVHGQLTCSILAEASASVAIGTEFEFFQSSSAGTLLFQSASLVNVYSKSGAMKITGQYSAATLKKVGTITWHVVGDLA